MRVMRMFLGFRDGSEEEVMDEFTLQYKIYKLDVYYVAFRIFENEKAVEEKIFFIDTGE